MWTLAVLSYLISICSECVLAMDVLGDVMLDLCRECLALSGKAPQYC